MTNLPSDVARCNNSTCPLRVSCWRFNSPVNEGEYQWSAMFEPDTLTTCSWYIDMDENHIITTP